MASPSATSELQNFRTSELQNFRTSELQNFRTSELQKHYIIPKIPDSLLNHVLDFFAGWSLTCIRFILAILFTLAFYQPVIAQQDSCTASECNYAISFDRTGFYIVAVKLPAGQREGIWSLIIDPPTAHRGSFHGGSVLDEGGNIPNWLGFSIAESNSVQIVPFNYTNAAIPFQLELVQGLENQQYQTVWGPTAVNTGQTYTVPPLAPGFYVAVAHSTGPRDVFGLSIGSPSLFGGVSGGWLDAKGSGFAAFEITQPQTVNLKLLFGSNYGEVGAGQPHLEVLYQKADGTRELKWSAPKIPEKSIGQKTSEWITTKVTDPKTKLAVIVTTKEKQELLAIHGDKDSKGNLTSVTDITYASKSDPTKSVNLNLGDDVIKPKVTVEFPDGKKIKVKNYDPVKKTANVTVTQTDEGGNETIVADLGNQPISDLPQQSSCFDQPGDFGKVLHDCVINKFVRPMINRIMGTFCELSEAIASGGGLNPLGGIIVKLSTGIANFASQMSGETGSFCKPFEDAPELEGVPPITCYTDPVNDILAFGKELGICLGDLVACTSKLPIDLFESLFDFLGSSSEMTGPECSSPAPASTGSCGNDEDFKKWCESVEISNTDTLVFYHADNFMVDNGCGYCTFWGLAMPHHFPDIVREQCKSFGRHIVEESMIVTCEP